MLIAVVAIGHRDISPGRLRCTRWRRPYAFCMRRPQSLPDGRPRASYAVRLRNVEHMYTTNRQNEKTENE